jgi:hypothetical protein
MSTLEFLLDALDEMRERLLVAIEPLDDMALLQQEAVNGWSIADVLSNITSWESELVTGLMKLDQNKRPGKLLSALADPAAYDQAFYDEMRDRNLDQIFEDLQLVRIQLEDWLSGFSEKDLTNPNRFRSLNGRSLRGIIAEATYKREERLLPAVEAFSEAWLSKQDELANNVIPLTFVEPSTQDENENSTN